MIMFGRLSLIALFVVLFLSATAGAQAGPKAGSSDIEPKSKAGNEAEKLLTYEAALAEAERKGLIRRLSRNDDVQAYLEALAKGAGLTDHIIAEGLRLSDGIPADPYEDAKLFRSYVVLSPGFGMPDNLEPPHYRVTYILPAGLPRPESVPDNAEVFSADYGPLSNTKKEISSACVFPKLKLPRELKVYAGSGFLGSPVDYAVGAERLRAELVPIKVNSPDEPVALILQSRAYGSTIWHFSWTEGTKIAAVVVSGGGEQRVIGLPKGVPVLISSNNNKPNQCPGLSVPSSLKTLDDITRLSAVNNLSKHFFKKNADQLYFSESCRSLIGDPLNGEAGLITAEELKIDELIDPNRPWGNKTTVTGDIFKGLIRKATVEDMRQRSAAIAREAGLPEHIINGLTLYDRWRSDSHARPYVEPNPIPDAYVVLSPDFGIPATLYQGEFIPIRGTTHEDRDRVSASFIYSDGSLARCFFHPGKYRSPGKPQTLETESSPRKRFGSNLPPNLKLIHKLHPLDDAYEVLPPNSISPALPSRAWDLSADFILPDGSNTYCSYQSIAEAVAAVKPKARGSSARSSGQAGDNPEYQIPAACAVPDFNPPPRLKVYAAGVRSGSKLDFPMGRRGDAAELVKITVNSPDEPAALMLAAYKPTIWHISWTPGTKIAAVVVNSDIHEQRVIGLPEDVRLLYGGGSYGDGPCPNFRVSLSTFGMDDLRTIAQAVNLNGLARHLFKKDADRMYEINNGQALIGPALRSDVRTEAAEEFSIGKFADPDTPLPGLYGLNDGLDKGFIRKAGDEDYEKWLWRHYTKKRGVPEDRIAEAMAKDRESRDGHPRPENAYVVLSPDFVIPAVLKNHGIDSAVFIVPGGMLPPTWPYDESSTFYLMEDGTCRGKEVKAVCKPRH